MPQHRRELNEAGSNVGLRPRLESSQMRQHITDLLPFRLRRQHVDDLLAKGHQPDRILLMDHQVAERRRDAGRVLELRQLVLVAVGHRPAQVHRQIAGNVRLGFELLDVVLVGFGVDEPVDVLRVVAVRVLAMLAELDREAMKRAGVESLHEPLHDELRAQIEPRDLTDHFRLQIFLDGGHGGARG